MRSFTDHMSPVELVEECWLRRGYTVEDANGKFTVRSSILAAPVPLHGADGPSGDVISWLLLPLAWIVYTARALYL